MTSTVVAHTATDLWTIIGVCGGIVTLVATVTAWALNSLNGLRTEIALLKSEITPNGGQTLAVGDRIMRIEQTTVDTAEALSGVSRALAEHVGWSRATVDRLDRVIAGKADK